ncbi:cysteine hydrolase family protein [Brachybacterium paraconglomeratum]|uniref:isochorismatase family protein n=1 Tax=Brachybacterium paraconglomeratum TaxID=173362 RepID=UPI0031E546A7
MTTPRRALLLIDVQNEYFSGPLEIQFPAHADSLPKITGAIDAATKAGIPIAVIQHTAGEDAPVFNPTMPGFALHPEIEGHRTEGWKSAVKRFGSVYADTDIAAWLGEQGVDTVTLVGYMTNNCVIASAVEGEGLGFTTEVLSDATGAINIANYAGFAPARTVHETIMALLHSNFAAVATTAAWTEAVSAGESLPKSDLGTSAVTGAQRAAGQDGASRASSAAR